MIARRFSAPSSRSTKRVIISRLVASSWMEISTLVARSYLVLQPRMHRAVPLFQLAQRRPPRTSCGAWPPEAAASTGRPPSSSPAACPGSPAARSFSPGAPQAAYARSLGTAVPSRLPAPALETPAATPCSTAARAVRALRPHRPQPRTSGATCAGCRPSVTPIRTARLAAAASTPSFTCLNTEMRSLSFRPSPFAPLLGSGSVVDRP